MIPQLRDWHQRYQADGLTIVAVHSPEFPWERSHDRVLGATRKAGILYPVVQDNDHAVWRRWGIWAWPTTFLVDRRGIVRYRHIGEGAVEATETAIRQLLAEPG